MAVRLLINLETLLRGWHERDILSIGAHSTKSGEARSRGGFSPTQIMSRGWRRGAFPFISERPHFPPSTYHAAQRAASQDTA